MHVQEGTWDIKSIFAKMARMHFMLLRKCLNMYVIYQNVRLTYQNMRVTRQNMRTVVSHLKIRYRKRGLRGYTVWLSITDHLFGHLKCLFGCSETFSKCLNRLAVCIVHLSI